MAPKAGWKNAKKLEHPAIVSDEELKKAREMLAGNKLKRSESFIPLGSKGLMDHPRHQRETKYSKDFAAEPRYAQVREGETA